LKPEHQLDQLVFAELLQISAIHAPRDSEIAPHGKGLGNNSDLAVHAAIAASFNPKNAQPPRNLPK
jgi:hypothetical protein